jgi:hypothetical protein
MSAPGKPTTSDVLREAARVLMEEGWSQGSAGWTSAGTRCVLGSLDEACVRIGMERGAWLAAGGELVLWLLRNGFTPSPIHWNDAPERTAEDVILALKQCAYDLEADA